MHTEAQLRRVVRTVLSRYGSLNITELIKAVKNEIPLDSDDIKPYAKRGNEMTIDHNIRNIESHVKKGCKTKYFDEGFFLDKNKKPAQFSLTTGIGTKLSIVSTNEIKKRRKISKAFHTTQKKLTQDDWEELNKRRSEIGLHGELFVLDKEKDFVGDELKDRIIHESQNSDMSGYDISSVDKKGNEKFIEVKTTTGKVSEPFFISENELNFIKLHKANSFIYRVYEFNKNSKTGKLLIIGAKDLLNNKKYYIRPNTYRVTKK